MLNYMKSEGFRIMKNRSLFILTLICAGLMAGLVLVLYCFKKVPSFPYSNTRHALANIYMQMNFLMLAVIAFGASMHNNEEKYHTIKHSVAFGIRRSTIFLGRFFVQVLASACIYVALTVMFTVLSYALLYHENVGELESLIRVSLGSVTCLTSSLAVTHLLLMNADNQGMAYVAAVSIVAVIPSLLNLLGRRVGLVQKLAELFPINVLAYNSPLVSAEGMAYPEILRSLAIGLVWTVLFLALGMVCFQHREIK